MRRDFVKVGWTLAAAVLVSGVAAASVASSAQVAHADDLVIVPPTAFHCSASPQTFVVPATGLTHLNFVVRGAAGGVGDPGSTPGNVAGKGGESAGQIAVTAGETLTIVVGCEGADGASGGAAGGTGYGNGGASGAATSAAGGGGGGSAVLIGSTPLFVAGGGGGSAPNSGAGGFGGDGGGGNLPGADGDSGSCAAGAGGHGATVNAAGSGGSATVSGSAGSATTGGAGASGGASGGGGGGGLFGGGGGASSTDIPCGGGGGGSGFMDPSVTSISAASGVQAGDGIVTLFEDRSTTETVSNRHITTVSTSTLPDAPATACGVPATAPVQISESSQALDPTFTPTTYVGPQIVYVGGDQQIPLALPGGATLIDTLFTYETVVTQVFQGTAAGAPCVAPSDTSGAPVALVVTPTFTG